MSVGAFTLKKLCSCSIFEEDKSMIMKRLIHTIIFMLCTGFISFAQFSEVQEAPKMDFSIYKDAGIADIREMEGNLYISLTYGAEENNGFYTFERSYDGENFIILSKRTFHANDNEELTSFTFINRLPERPAIYRTYKFTPTEVVLVNEYLYEPKMEEQVATND